MCYNMLMRKGQAVLEYVLALAGMIVVSAILWYVVEADEGAGLYMGLNEDLWWDLKR